MEAFGFSLRAKLTPAALKALGDPSIGILYDENEVFSNPTDAMQFFVNVYKYRAAFLALSAEDQAAADTIFKEAFGFSLRDKLTPAVLKQLGDSSLGILYNENGVFRNPTDAMQFFVNVYKYRAAFLALSAEDQAAADTIFKEAFGFSLRDKLTPAVLKRLGDSSIGILYNENGVFRNPADAMQFFVNVYKYRAAFQALNEEDQAAVDSIFKQAFGFSLHDKITQATLKALGDETNGILYGEDGVFRDPAKAMQFFINVYKYLQAFSKLSPADQVAVNYVFNQAFKVTLGGRVTPGLLKTLGNTSLGILYDIKGVFRDPDKAMQFFVGVYNYWQAFGRLGAAQKELASQLFFKIFGVKLGGELTPDILRTLGDPKFGILYDENGILRNPQFSVNRLAIAAQLLNARVYREFRGTPADLTGRIDVLKFVMNEVANFVGPERTQKAYGANTPEEYLRRLAPLKDLRDAFDGQQDLLDTYNAGHPFHTLFSDPETLQGQDTQYLFDLLSDMDMGPDYVYQERSFDFQKVLKLGVLAKPSVQDYLDLTREADGALRLESLRDNPNARAVLLAISREPHVRKIDEILGIRMDRSLNDLALRQAVANLRRQGYAGPLTFDVLATQLKGYGREDVSDVLKLRRALSRYGSRDGQYAASFSLIKTLEIMLGGREEAAKYQYELRGAGSNAGIVAKLTNPAWVRVTDPTYKHQRVSSTYTPFGVVSQEVVEDMDGFYQPATIAFDEEGRPKWKNSGNRLASSYRARRSERGSTDFTDLQILVGSDKLKDIKQIDRIEEFNELTHVRTISYYTVTGGETVAPGDLIASITDDEGTIVGDIGVNSTGEAALLDESR